MADVLKQLQFSYPSLPVPDLYARYKEITDRLGTATVQNPQRLTTKKLKEVGTHQNSIHEAVAVSKSTNPSRRRMCRRQRPMIVSIRIQHWGKETQVDEDHYGKKTCIRQRKRSQRLASLRQLEEEGDPFLDQILVEQQGFEGSRIIDCCSPEGGTNSTAITRKRRSLRLKHQEIEKDKEMRRTNISKLRARSYSHSSEEDVKVVAMTAPSQQDSVVGMGSLTNQANSFPKFGQDLWCDLYHPKEARHVIGNQDALHQLWSWLSTWKDKCCVSSDGSSTQGREDHPLPTVLPKAAKRQIQKHDEVLTSRSWSSLQKGAVVDDPDFQPLSRPSNQICPLPLSDCSDSFNGDWDKEDDLLPIMLVCGAVGCGKTAAVYACAEELGFKVCPPQQVLYCISNPFHCQFFNNGKFKSMYYWIIINCVHKISQCVH